MKTFVRLRVACASLLVVACVSPLWGIGRGGGGGGGGGGAARPNFGGGGSAASRPNINQGGASRPSTSSRPSISNPTPSTRPSQPSASRPGGGSLGNSNQRPSFPNQSGGSGGANLGMGDRPGMRPGSGTGLNPNQPGLWNKPGSNNKLPGGAGNNSGNTANINNRPGGVGNNSGNTANINNRPGGIGNNSGNNVNINNVHNNNWNGGGGNYWNNGGGYGHYHGDWYHGSCNGSNWYNRPAAWWGAGFVSGAVVSSFMPYSWGYASYSNPYYVEPYPVGNTVINYSQPIVMSAPPANPPANPPADSDPLIPAPPTAEEQASKMLGDARTAFYGEDYATALTQVDQAIQKSPSDPVLHEFRGLVLFATKKYDQAAPTIYAVLSAGPGWDWTTLVSLYADVETYTQQLRALESYRRANPQSAQARFLLAYHYLTGGHSAAALTEFKEVVKLQPADQLAAQMVKTLTPPAEGEVAPAPEDSAVATTPVEADKLVGSWKAAQPDGSVVALTVSADNKFSWKFTQNKKPQEFTGTSTLADNLLILRPAEGPPLVGQVAMLADNKLNFRLDANNPGDPGLTFVR